MIILEDSIWNKLVKFAGDTKAKITTKAQTTKDKRLDDIDFSGASEGVKIQKIKKALSNKPNLELSEYVWVEELSGMDDPLQSELYDFLMNSKSEFMPQVATIIVKLFRNYKQLTAKLAIDSLNLDNPEYTETNDKIAELIKETKDIMTNNVYVDPTVYKIYRILYDIKNFSQVKKEVNSMPSTALEDKIAKTWQKRIGLTDEQVTELKTKTTLFEPGRDIIDLAESSMGNQDDVFLKIWQGKIEEWIKNNGNKNKQS